MKLIELVKGIKPLKIYGSLDKNISYITDNTKNIIKNSLFIAIKGTKIDSHLLIPQAVSNGATVIMGQDDFNKEWGDITYIKVKNSREGLSVISANWCKNPSRKLKIIGVTGTDGKTTTANLVYWILKRSGKKVGIISTINAKIGDNNFDTGFHVTNPGSIELQRYLSLMVDQKCEFAVLEVTSHGIDQKRIYGIKFETAALTNITPEHLDYHKTFENYRSVKAKLFNNVKYAILNKDDDSYQFIKKNSNATKIFSYSLSLESDYFAFRINSVLGGTKFTIKTKSKEIKITTTLSGDYNVSNTLCAIAVVRRYKITWKQIVSALKSFPTPEGRFEEIKNKKGIKIYIDFAHTPNSLKGILSFLKLKTNGRLIAVFGCASERDNQKRTSMPQISIKHSDISVFTAEDPRYEDINEILNIMDVSAKSVGGIEINDIKSINSVKTGNNKLFIKIPERGDAIYTSILKIAKKGDTVVICGKGHEQSMSYNGTEYPWSDKEAVEMALVGKVKKIPWKNH